MSKIVFEPLMFYLREGIFSELYEFAGEILQEKEKEEN